MSDTALHITAIVVCILASLFILFLIIANRCFDDKDKDMDWYDSQK